MRFLGMHACHIDVGATYILPRIPLMDGIRGIFLIPFTQHPDVLFLG